jgi:hypothetical protein
MFRVPTNSGAIEWSGNVQVTASCSFEIAGGSRREPAGAGLDGAGLDCCGFA